MLSSRILLYIYIRLFDEARQNAGILHTTKIQK